MANIYYLALVLLLLTLFSVIESLHRIVGGELVKITDIPYQLSLRRFGQHVCGAALLSPTLAISAAHCLPISGAYSIKGGVSDLLDSGQVSHVNTALIHPKYNADTNDYDVSLLFLSTPLNFSEKVGSVRLPVSSPRPGMIGKVSGWGVTKPDQKTLLSVDLRVIEVPIIDFRNCKNIYFSEFTHRMFCAGFMDGGKDACLGDSGGPLVVGGVLYGIISSGVDCARKGYPGIYTDVFSVIDFIRQNGRL